MNTPQVSVTSHAPSYDPLTCEFRQMFTFKSPFPLDQAFIGKVVDAASELYATSLGWNELLDFAWPPDQTALKAQPDMKGGAIEFTTRASRARPIILDA